jgi:hypothetical protein
MYSNSAEKYANLGELDNNRLRSLVMSSGKLLKVNCCPEAEKVT